MASTSRDFDADRRTRHYAQGRRGLVARVVALLAPVPMVCFSGALLTDIAYLQSAEMQWANFSAWLLLFGMVFGGLAAVAAAILVVRRRTGRESDVRVRIVGSIVVLILALFNNFVHSRDAWTSVVPTGLTLSALTVLAMIVTAALAAATSPKINIVEAR